MIPKRSIEFWACFQKIDGVLHRFDTRIYPFGVDSPTDQDECMGAIVGKNPGSALPKRNEPGKLVEIDLNGDKLLPTVRNILKNSKVDLSPGSYVQVLNLFYVCQPDLGAAISKARSLPEQERCPSERQNFPWVWFAWGGADEFLNPLKKRFRKISTSRIFFFENKDGVVSETIPIDSQLAKHTQGLKHAPVISYLREFLAPRTTKQPNHQTIPPTMLHPETLRARAAELFPEIQKIRRHLHTHPELSYREVETGKFISQTLTDWGVEHETGWADNGIVVNIHGELPGEQTFALRADIDALPIEEENDVPYRSQNAGVMHACGHDVHTSCLLGAVKLLHELRPHFGGTVRAIFQPAEEMAPGGASILIKEGVLKNPVPAGIVGQHVHPPLEVGKVGVRPGIYMASTDELYLTVRGRGGHGALPHTTNDPIVITAHLITALQTVVSRMANPTTPCVLTFGQINSTGGNTNVIPEEVKLKGTFRTMNEAWRAEGKRRMTKLVEELAASMGGTAELRIVHGYPYLENNPALVSRWRAAAEEFLGAENVIDLPIRMTGEDFAYYSHEIPGCFYRLGIRNEAAGITHGLHTPRFDVDERCLETGMGVMTWSALSLLQTS